MNEIAQKIRLLRVVLELSQQQFADRMNVSRGTVQAAQSTGEASDKFIRQLQILERDPSVIKAAEKQGIYLAKSPKLDNPPESPKIGEKSRHGTADIKILSRAHAGEAAEYEELPADWQDLIPSDCEDPAAFALVIEGDSMEPSYRTGDILVLMPSFKPQNDDLVVAKMVDNGVVFRVFNFSGDHEIILTPYNQRFPQLRFREEQFIWIYPVYSSTRKFNRRRKS